MNHFSPRPPPLHVSRWFNTPKPIFLDRLLGKVVAIHTFQMLCPACVTHGLPQASRLREAFPEDQLAVIGLHTVFEHHRVMGDEALETFIREFRLSFPIGVDEADPRGAQPRTMAAWGLRGTPSLILLGREGGVEFSHFGRIGDMAVGGMVGQLLGQVVATPNLSATNEGERCDGDACAAPRLST